MSAARGSAGPTIVKIGGSLLERPEGGAAAVLDRVAGAWRDGEAMVVVHGGGDELTRWLEALGIASEFRDGQRVTSPEMLPAAIAVLGGLVNRRVVEELLRRGCPAVGVTGADGGATRARPAAGGVLGAVGEIDVVSPAFYEDLIAAGRVPVVASLAWSAADGWLNVNADLMAAALAAGLRARRLILTTDVEGVRGADGATIPHLTIAALERLIAGGLARDGMIPKLRACRAALAAGVPEVRIVGAGAAALDGVFGPPTAAGVGDRDDDGTGAGPSAGTIVTAEPIAQADRHLFPTYARPDVVLVSGHGCRVRDDRGREYLDMLGGIAVNALGHAHPRILAVLRAAAGDGALLHASNLFHHPWQGPLAARLAALTGLPRVFLCNSGTEAVEAALKLARARALRRKGRGATRIVAIDGSFHGRTAFALSATGQPKYRRPFEPLVPDVVFAPPDDAAALQAAAGPETAAILLEPIQGEGGVRPLSAEFMRAARALCDAHDALLIADEVQCGLGRTGEWSACAASGVRPDLMTLAKPLAAGLPLGALLGREDLRDDLGPGAHGSTFGGGPLPCRLALAFLDAVEQDGLLDNVAARGEQLMAGARALAARHAGVGEVRGRGLMVGIVLRDSAAEVVARLRERGVLAGTAGDRVLRLLPPFVVTEAEIAAFLAALDATLSSVEAARSSLDAAGSGARAMPAAPPTTEARP